MYSTGPSRGWLSFSGPLPTEASEHAFSWPGTPAFNQAARGDAWARIPSWLAS